MRMGKKKVAGITIVEAAVISLFYYAGLEIMIEVLSIFLLAAIIAIGIIWIIE